MNEQQYLQFANDIHLGYTADELLRLAFTHRADENLSDWKAAVQEQLCIFTEQYQYTVSFTNTEKLANEKAIRQCNEVLLLISLMENQRLQSEFKTLNEINEKRRNQSHEYEK